MLNQPPIKATLSTLLTSGLLLGAASVTAHEPGTHIFRLGAATVAPNEDSDALAVNGDVSLLGGAKAEVDSNTQLGITYTYMLNDNLGVGVLAATPFEHDLQADLGGLGLGDVDAGSLKHLPPTVTLQYFPLANSSAFQPYIALGINYTTFFEEEVDSNLEGIVDAAFGPAGIVAADVFSSPVRGELEVEDSWGLAFEAGFDYALSENWTLSGQVWYLDIDTEAEFTFADSDGNSAKVDADVDIDPWVYMIGLGYKF